MCITIMGVIQRFCCKTK